MSRHILIVAAHPDDELLGPGATIARHADRGDRVDILILAEGATSRGGSIGDVSALQKSAAAAAAIVGANAPRFGGLPDNRMDSVPLLDVVKLVERLVEELRPSIVYTHHAGDMNIDHGVVQRAVMTACRPLPGHPTAEIYAFETLSSTEWAPQGAVNTFQPRMFIDASAGLARKLEALRCYPQEMREFPHARSLPAVEALARYRGASAGMAAAEAFDILRVLQR